MVQEWRIRVSIPVPPACEAGALPFELIPCYYNPFIRHTSNNLLTKSGKIGQLQIVFNARHIQDGANQQTLQPGVIRLLNISSACSGYYCKSKFHQMSIIDRGFNKCRQGSWKNALTFRVDKLKKSSGKL